MSSLIIKLLKMGNFVPFLSSLQEEEMNVSRFEVWITGFETQCKKHEGK